MKVIVADKISERGVQLLQVQSGWNIVQTTKDTLNAELPDADALIVRSATKVTADLLERAKKLRAVGRAGVGVDNIDLDEATKRGVLVMSTPGGSSVSVAEHTFALLLALVRQLPRFDAAMREGRWEKSSSGAEVRGKTLGLDRLGPHRQRSGLPRGSLRYARGGLRSLHQRSRRARTLGRTRPARSTPRRM